MSHYDYSKVDNFLDYCETIAANRKNGEAYELISSKLDQTADRYLNDFIMGLNFLQTEKSLDWIEFNSDRIKNVSQTWGHLAASSHMSWTRTVKWLSLGRPLSLIALDTLMFCTTLGERLNQSPWMQNLKPQIDDLPKQDIVTKSLFEYLELDNVHRTRTTVEYIIENLKQLENKRRNTR